jgi:hypothetical protein
MDKSEAKSAEIREADKEIDRQVARLRELLEMMGPETGSSALGAMRKAAPQLPLAERVRALSSYRR